jgi:hypothetical protein
MAVVAAVGMAIAIVDTLSVVDERTNAGHPVPYWQPLVWETTSVAVLVVLSPAIMAFTRRVWPLRLPRVRMIALHLAAAVAYSLVHVAAMGGLRWAVYALVGDHYAPLSPLANWPYELRKDVLVYAAIVAIYVGWRLLRDPREPRDPAGEGGRESIEVRDGARRHWVPLAEVAWIEAAGNYVELHRGHTPILHRAPLSEMERQLHGQGFVRIHRSRLVQRAQIAQVESKPSGDYVVTLADGRELAGSRRFRRPLLEP